MPKDSAYKSPQSTISCNLKMILYIKSKQRQDVATVLNRYEVAGQTIPLTITGNLKDEYGNTQIKGQDCVKIKVKKLR